MAPPAVYIIVYHTDRAHRLTHLFERHPKVKPIDSSGVAVARARLGQPPQIILVRRLSQVCGDIGSIGAATPESNVPRLHIPAVVSAAAAVTIHQEGEKVAAQHGPWSSAQRAPPSAQRWPQGRQSLPCHRFSSLLSAHFSPRVSAVLCAFVDETVRVVFVPTGRCYSAERASLRVLLVGPPPEQREGRDPGAGCSD